MISFVAIDSSSTSIAFAYFVDNELYKYGKINFKGKDLTARLRDAARKTQGLFLALPVDKVVIESSFYSANPSTATNLALCQGAILGAAAVQGTNQFAKVVPINWQKNLGNPSWTKEQKEELKRKFPDRSKGWYSSEVRKRRKEKTIQLINERYDILVTDDDVADAIGVGSYVLDKPEKIEWK